MHKELPTNFEESSNDNLILNVVLADTEWETFEISSRFKKRFNFLNLSSDFAVDFILEYEKIDVVLISKNISGIRDIVTKARKKKASVYIMGEDLTYPPLFDDIEKILEDELIKRSENLNDRNRKNGFSALKGFFFVKKDKNIQKEQGPGKNQKSRKAQMEKSDLLKVSPLPESPGRTGETEISASLQKNKNVIKNICKENLKDIKDYIAIKQKIIVFIKAKGGVGSTTLSLFLAYQFKRLKTLLIDMNFSEGGSDLGYYLGIPKTPNMIVYTEDYSRNAMDNSVINIKENLDVLQAPPTYELSKKLDLQDIYSLVDTAKKKYHLIIFDLPNQINDIYFGVLDMADLVVLVSDHTPGSIGRLVSINNRFFYNDLEKILVINRQKNGSARNLLNGYVQQCFKSKEIVILAENKILGDRGDFSSFDFSVIKDFSIFSEKIMERLTYDR